ncbi:MAG: hypothetical protein OHK0046_49870 [Anaerolineae bacterium]
MAQIKIPTPLRVYTEGQAEIAVSGDTVGAALQDLIAQHPDLKPHLFNNDELRNFVNIFLGDEDVRFLDGLETPINDSTNLRIIPSIAGGRDALRRVDQTGLKTGQALTILLLIAAFLVDSWVLVAFVGLAQFLGALDATFAPYRLFYQKVVKPLNIAKPNVITDNPEPHRFAMLVGSIFNTAAVLALLAGIPVVGWTLVAIVVALANLNFWLSFCLGCWMYYQFNRLGVPGFTRAPLTE